MIAFPRRAARWFHTACARCAPGRPRGPDPPVVIRPAPGRVTLTAAFPDVTLELACPGPAHGAGALVVPLAALGTIGAAAPGLVELEGGAALTGTARWAENGVPRAGPVELLPPGPRHDPLPRPHESGPVPARFRDALHEAARTARRGDGRSARSRVQVRGAAGQVVATDGRVAVRFDGFALPFAGDLLVPAVPVFGAPGVRDAADVRVGATPGHLVVGCGPWTVWLTIAPAGRFPDVTGAIPTHARTSVALGRDDAAGLLPRLPGLPGRDHALRPVTLDADRVLRVVGRDAGTGAEEGVVLARSPVTGPAARAALDRRALARVLALGCTELRLAPGRALVGAGPGVTVLVAPLDPDLAVRPPRPELPEPERSDAMKPHETSGAAPTGRREPPSDTLDPLAAAEDLRAALGAALTGAARLVAALKAGRREKKALASVYSSLKQLNLDQP